MIPIKFKVWEYPNLWHGGKLLEYDSIINNTMQYLSNPTFDKDRKILQFTGLVDSQGNELYEDDILSFEYKGEVKEFRVYRWYGGFVMKALPWNTLDDLKPTDVVEPLADLQTRTWIKDNCIKRYNYNENKK